MDSGLREGAVLAGRYELHEELGRGERSVAFAARDLEANRTLAIKLVQPPAASAPLVCARIAREIKRVRQFDHPALVRPYATLELDDQVGVAMEWIDGPDLETRVAKEGGLAPEEVARIARELADVLAVAHRRGVLHRNIKPRNVLFDTDDHARLADLGCARIEGQALLTGEVDEPVQRVDFLAPEVVGGRVVDARADLYALGMTLYFALVGRAPALADDGLPPAPRAAGFSALEARPDVPEWLDAIIARATCADPADRFETAERLQSALETCCAGYRRPAPAAAPSDVCVLCGEPGTLRRAVCWSCEDEGPADTFLLLEPTEHLAERARVLGDLTGDSGSAALERVARGAQPLAQVSARQATRLAGWLWTHQLPARSLAVDEVSRVRRWLGSWGPLLPSRSVPRRPPSALIRKLVEVLPELDIAEPRKLLIQMLGLGRGLFARFEALPDSGHARGTLAATLIAAADAARELAGIDPVIGAMQLHGERRYEPPVGLIESRRLYESARSCVVQSLLEACAALAELAETDDLEPAAAAERLIEVGRVLGEDSCVAAETAKEALALFTQAGKPEAE